MSAGSMPPRRMSARRLVASCALALLVPTVLTAPARADTSTGTSTGAVDEPPASVSTRRVKKQRVRLEALPQIVQHGGRVAAADKARAAITATVRPVRPGRRVQLQVQRGDAWQAVTTVRQDRRGRAQFAAAPSEGGHALTYRVRAMRVRGLRPVTSGVVSTARWLRPTWTEEFSGDSLGPEWNHRGRDYDVRSRRSCAKGDPRAVRVGGGAVRLSVIKDPDATSRCRIRGRDAARGRYAYRLNGHIGTEGAFGFRYGVAAARVKFHRHRGQHGAFWLQTVGGRYVGGSEIDVVEYFGDRHPQGGLATFVHRYGAKRTTRSGGWIPNEASYRKNRRDGWSRNYHVFSVEWTPTTLVFRIDGKETTRMGAGVSNLRQFPVLSLIPADYEIPKIAERKLPQQMYVDWVRVWETGE